MVMMDIYHEMEGKESEKYRLAKVNREGWKR